MKRTKPSSRTFQPDKNPKNPNSSKMSNTGLTFKLVFHLGQSKEACGTWSKAVMIKVLVIGLRRPPLEGSICDFVAESVVDGLCGFHKLSSHLEPELAKARDAV